MADLVLYPPMLSRSNSLVKQFLCVGLFFRGADAKAIPRIASHCIASGTGRGGGSVADQYQISDQYQTF